MATDQAHEDAGLDDITTRFADATHDWREGIQVDSCPEFERILVQTRHTPYELIVLCGERGEVLVRGGALFPEFQPATLVGATAGGSSVKVMGIYVGLRMELFAGHQAIITSPVETISREAPAPRG